tara:strand:+ start:230 stop:490 length:261 start_codon:yes stop_codon:yes gene_type:complete
MPCNVRLEQDKQIWHSSQAFKKQEIFGKGKRHKLPTNGLFLDTRTITNHLRGSSNALGQCPKRASDFNLYNETQRNVDFAGVSEGF